MDRVKKITNPTSGRQMKFLDQTHKRLIRGGQMPVPFGYSINDRRHVVKMFDPDFFLTPDQYEFVAPRLTPDERLARRMNAARAIQGHWRRKMNNDVVITSVMDGIDGPTSVQKLWNRLAKSLESIRGTYYVYVKFYKDGEGQKRFIGVSTNKKSDLREELFKTFLAYPEFQGEGVVRLFLYKQEKGVDYHLNLRDGEYNCLIKSIRDTLLASNDKRKTQKLRRLDEYNTKYYDCGVPRTAIPEIAGGVNVNVSIANALGDRVYSYQYSSGHYPTVKYIIPYDGHVDAFVDDAFDLRAKEIQYCQDLQKSFEEHKGWKVCQYEGDKTTIKYWYNATTLFKAAEAEEIDGGDPYINTRRDAMIKEFMDDHQIFFNSIYKSKCPDLFDFVESAVHYISGDYVFQDNMAGIGELFEGDRQEDNMPWSIFLNFDKLTCYDRNKGYAAFALNNYYQAYKFPATGKLEFYSVDGLPTEPIIKRCGFCQIKDISFVGCPPNVRKYLERVEYLIERRIYPNPVLSFFWDNGVRFSVMATAYTNWQTDLAFTEAQIKEKWFQHIIGIFDSKEEYKTAYMHVPNKAERQHLMLYSADRICHHDDKVLKFKIARKELRNNCHLAAFMLGYHAIGMFDRLFSVPYEEVVYFRVDWISCKKPQAFDIGTAVGQWKIEAKTGVKEINPTAFTSFKKDYTAVPEVKLSAQKLRFWKINVTAGPAGSGKTSQKIKKFDNMDERLFNAVVALPNNDLKKRFAKEFGVKCSTLHKLFLINSDGNNNGGIKIAEYANVIIDESSMLPVEYMDKILATAEKHHVNLHFLGDLDLQTGNVFQLPPVNSSVFLTHPVFRTKDARFFRKTVNHRQQADPEFAAYLDGIRGKSNEEVKATLKRFARVGLPNVIELYTDGDVIIASVNSICKDINEQLAERRETLRVKYKKTTKTTAKNEIAFVKKEDFDDKTMDLAFATTIHLAQGATLEGRVFVIARRLFEENMLYVALSRAKKADQIVVVI